MSPPNAQRDHHCVLTDVLVTHSLVLRANPEALPIAVVHIFRFASNRVVELWDLGQELMKDSTNENGPFF